MKITLDQNALAQAVIHHLRNVGVTADITQVDFRYTRVPYAVFAEIELSEARVQAMMPKATPPVVEKVVEVAVLAEPIVDPSKLPPEEPEAPAPEMPSSPIFGV